MKENSDLKVSRARIGLAAVLLGHALLVPLASAESDVVVRAAGGVSYVSGGVGDESLDRIKGLVADFNVKLVLALNNGEYLSDVRIAIADSQGKTLVDTPSEGPWFLVNLPAGTYQLVATYAGKEVRRQVAVGPGKLTTVHLRWNAD